MRRSYRLALIAAVVAVSAVVAPSRDLLFARSRPGPAPRVVGSPALGPPLRRAGEDNTSTREALLATLRGVPLANAPGLSPTSVAGWAAASGRVSRPLAADAGAAGVHWIGVFAAADEPLVAVAGIDFAAPRPLVLWKLDALRGHATPVTRLQSEVGRPFLAEHLLLSARGARLVVAPSGSDPFGPRASTILEVPTRDGNRRESL